MPLPEGDLRGLIIDRGPGAYPTPPSSGNAFSREFLEQVLPVPEQLRVCADGYLYDLAPLFGRVARLDRPGGAIRFHDRSNFMAEPYDDRLPHSVLAHELTIARMAELCRELGIRPDQARWWQRSWPLRSQAALADIARTVPAGTPFVMVDGAHLHPPLNNPGPASRNRRGPGPRAVRSGGGRPWVCVERGDNGLAPRYGGHIVIGIGVNVFLIVVGAILAFATHVSSSGIDLNVVGVVLIVAGLIGLFVTVLIWRPRRRVDRFGEPLVDDSIVERRPVIHRRRVIRQPSVVEERRVYEDPTRPYDDPPL